MARKLLRFDTGIAVIRNLLTQRSISSNICDVKRPNFEDEVFKGMSSHFPCLDKMEGRQNDIKNGVIQGMYGEDVSGYQVYQHAKPFKFKVGGILPKIVIAYETWGELNTARDNVVLIHTGLSGSSHAKSSKVTIEMCSG